MDDGNLKKRILREVSTRGLTSFMNRTKWLELQASIRNELPFAPPYQRKDLLQSVPEPPDFETDVWYLGDWLEGILPFETIEWVRIRPRYEARPNAVSRSVVHDCGPELKAALKRHSIAFEEADGCIWVYGYR